MITHSFVMAVLESYRMAEKQIRHLSRILPNTWELIFIDDGSVPEIEIPGECPRHMQIIRTRETRQAGEWTQHEAINQGVIQAQGHYIVKNDVDHIFSAAAIQACDSFDGDMRLFHRRAGVLTEDLNIFEIDHLLHSPVDDIYIMRRSLFLEHGGYPMTRRYGKGGKEFWYLSERPEAQPVEGATIYVTPDTHENYHGLERIVA